MATTVLLINKDRYNLSIAATYVFCFSWKIVKYSIFCSELVKFIPYDCS